ncbi:MAG: competence/damage-inducible protein A [Rhizobiales bacterium]|nr:competence/damage-inducible protein A [Hyphomicrobiales bacterium]MBO6697800.1 competence/damage-inducible protein A [Hyphomicrobiales bacterium]MBO6735945.1 competence/damage-inducible protein A [Hyphomicrobiales bacterium]MBO6912415.1 competence/damage-inducible protein A [Hyphomicrobiales bacterium]MBO6955045.1 competence/damage-inducible protein A [Hyphomicrobiales bacterium]
MTATASMLVIGDEILSGKTKDKNIGVLAEALTMVGIDLVEVRIVSDDEAAIVEALNALRAQTSYVFTSGGIGPTHDDITADSVAKAFGVGIGVDPRAYKLLSDFYAKTDREMNAGRERMTRIPDGADLIDNPVSIAPGFRIGSVHVMAGVPSVFAAMLESVLPTLEGGLPIAVNTLPFNCGEGDLAESLAAIDADHPEVAIGSYPKLVDGKFSTEIVLRSRDAAALDAATQAAQKLRTQLDAA